MNAVLLEQTASHLTRQTLRWDRRLRLMTGLIWVPRGLMIGLMIGIVVAVISRLRPWLLPEQIALVAVVALIVCGVGTAALIGLWPRSATHKARYFDRRFGLKERISTALELTGGAIPLPDHLAERQLNDAVNAARRVDLAARLPLRVQWRELLGVIALAGLLIYLLQADNPHNDELRAQRDLQNAMDSQAAALEEAIQDIENNPALSDEEKDALTKPLEEAQAILQQPGVSQEEAVAALAEASQSLQELSDGMGPEQETAYQQAADQLAASELTSDMAEALKKPDLTQTAQEMDELADKLGEENLSEEELQKLADALERAANELSQDNPALADKLREAADALRRGDIEAAQQALREAAELAREQDQDLQSSPMAQAAQQGQQEVNESQREMAQAGKEPSGQAQATEREPTREGENPPEGLQPQSQTGQQSPGQGEDSQQTAQDGSEQTAQQGDESQPGQGQQAGEGQPQAQGEGQPQAGEGEEGQTGGEAQQGSSGAAEPGEQPGTGGTEGSQTGQGEPATGAQPQQQGGLSAGTGSGGAGTDTTTGSQQTGAGGEGEIPTNNNPGEGNLYDYNPVYGSTTIGGESDQTIDVGGEGAGQEGEIVEEGEFGPNPEGTSMLSYSTIFGSYQNIVSDALENGRIPLDQRDVIHDYFSSLEQAE